LAYRSAAAAATRLLGLGSAIADRSFTIQHRHRCLKPFLPGSDELRFLGFLLTQGERRLAVGFQTS
jgi:hypothetical protein